jgi:hypothetical protein
MTALREYLRLECPGIWREAPKAQRREVIVAFGDATLVISDGRSARALAHWSLPALVRRNPGRTPALYSPGTDSGEELELDDTAMIAAIEKLHAIIASRRPRPGRLRATATIAALIAGAAVALFWLPGALIAHAARVAPPAKRIEIGRAVLGELSTLTGTACASEAAAPVLATLSQRLLGGGEIVLVPTTLQGALRLPGRIVVLGMPVLHRYDTAEAAAGHVLVAELAAEMRDPLLDVLHWAGLGATFRMLTTGNLPAAALTGYGQHLLTSPPAPPGAAALSARFARAEVAIAPYVQTLDPAATEALAALVQDPETSPGSYAPLMSDFDWVTLQGACTQ